MCFQCDTLFRRLSVPQPLWLASTIQNCGKATALNKCTGQHCFKLQKSSMMEPDCLLPSLCLVPSKSPGQSINQSIMKWKGSFWKSMALLGCVYFRTSGIHLSIEVIPEFRHMTMTMSVVTDTPWLSPPSSCCTHLHIVPFFFLPRPRIWLFRTLLQAFTCLASPPLKVNWGA